jgi:molybdenum cofactor cytidylyltransferase
MRVAGLVLAAGVSSRFGSPKALALLHGRPLLQHVLDAVAATPLDPVLVVLGHAAEAVESTIEWHTEVRLRNPDPARGLASSLHLGLDDLGAVLPRVDAAVIALGDQPRTRPEVIEALLDAAARTEREIVAPRYADGGGINPVLLRRAAFPLADRARGDRGLGPVIAAHLELVEWVDVPGSNADVDTPDDLVRLVEADWAERVRKNRAQVERIREVPDGPDFYAPVRSIFRADPDRADDPVVDHLVALARPDEVWLDIGAGAGRYALPLARRVREVIAVDPSPGMLAALREGAAEAGITNVRTVEGRWPPDEALRAALGPDPIADVALIAHVGYDVESIGPFVDAMECSARRLCVAVMMDRQPGSLAEGFWPPVHGEERVRLPALPEFAELLRVRNRSARTTIVEQSPRRFESREDVARFVRRQLWIADGGEKERRFHAALGELVVEADGGYALAGQAPFDVGIVEWAPIRGS